MLRVVIQTKKGVPLKRFMTLLVPALVAGVAVASTATSVTEVNSAIQQILAQFQNRLTAVKVEFKKIEIDDVRAKEAEVTIGYKKSGSVTTLELNIPKLSYDYGDGTAPTTKLRGQLKLDLTKVFSQREINDLVPSLEQAILDTAAGMTEEYGDAISMDVKITDKKQDEQGNYVSMKGRLKFKFDFAKLPPNRPKNKVLLSAGQIDVNLNVQTGVGFNVSIVSNPEFDGFKKDNDGLKEYLEKLLAKDPEVLNSISRMVFSLDNSAERIVNGR
jgi:hypothetical protein